MSQKRLRVIEQLRKLWPYKTWKYDNQLNQWRASSGMRVEPRALLSPRTPNGDDSYTTRYYRVDDGRYDTVNIVDPHWR